MTKLKRNVTACLTGLVLQAGALGCTIFPEQETPPVNTYVFTFDPHASNPWPTCISPDGTLLVSVPREQAGYDTTGIAYLLRPQEIKYYAYHHWAESPGRLLVPLLVEAMEKTNCWSTVAQTNTLVHADYRLDTEILRLQQEFFSAPSHLRLSVRAQLVNTQTAKVIAAQNFEIVEKTPSEDAYGAVTAGNLAVNKLMKEIAAWVKASEERNR
jgi:cholesterol transport system auxiliary component